MGLPKNFDAICPLEYRYEVPEELRNLLSDAGFTSEKVGVERALVQELCDRKICSEQALDEIWQACNLVTPAEIAVEERRTHHDIQAMVNCLQGRVSDGVKQFVHWMLTSYDVVDTANARRYKLATKLLANYLFDLRTVLKELALQEADTVMVGRTHGQHGVPITCGFWLIGYVTRLDDCIRHLHQMMAHELTGKISGAVGAYNAMSLIIRDVQEFERSVLYRLDLKPTLITTQIVPPEGTIRLFSEVTLAMGILADLANDIRQLQRTEIGEVSEEFGKDQVGSSAMPQKRNPVRFENIVSVWKLILPRIITLYMSQVSEHQRDLTGSAASRTYGETLAYVAYAVKSMTSLMKKVRIDRERMRKNIGMTNGGIAAEALRTLLAKYGYPDGHEAVRQLTLEAAASGGVSLWSLAEAKPELQVYTSLMTADEAMIIQNPEQYIGISAELVRSIT